MSFYEFTDKHAPTAPHGYFILGIIVGVLGALIAGTVGVKIVTVAYVFGVIMIEALRLSNYYAEKSD